MYEFSLFGNGRYLHYNGSGTVLARVETVDVCEWILVSKDQRIKALDNATEEQGVDATFYVTELISTVLSRVNGRKAIPVVH